MATKERFWASRNDGCDDITLWKGPRPYKRKGWWRSRIGDEHTWLGTQAYHFFWRVHRFSIDRGRCIEITDPRVERIK